MHDVDIYFGRQRGGGGEELEVGWSGNETYYGLFHLLLIQKSLEVRTTRLSRSVSNAERRKEMRATPDFMKEFQQRKQRIPSKGTAGIVIALHS